MLPFLLRRICSRCHSARSACGLELEFWVTQTGAVIPQSRHPTANEAHWRRTRDGDERTRLLAVLPSLSTRQLADAGRLRVRAEMHVGEVHRRMA
jgi:hypothetical protein